MNKPVLYIFLILISISISLNAQQNLLNNGDFENFDECPSGESTPGNYQLEHCLGWHTPTDATPDYMNPCNNTVVDVPTNIGGFQMAYSGSSYAGIIAFSYQQGWWFEYIQGTISPLTSGKKYTISFYVSCGEGYSNITISKIGALMSSSLINNNNSLPISLTPTILNSTKLTDTVGWQKISGEFYANGSEQYITIGYFGDTNFIDTSYLQSFNFETSKSAYYFIDHVEIYESENQNFTNIFSPNGDWINDFIDFSTFCSETQSIIILNRWGNIVFNSTDGSTIWNGIDNSTAKPHLEGVYYCLFLTENKVFKTEFIHLVR